MLCIETVHLWAPYRNLREPQENSREPWAPWTPQFRALDVILYKLSYRDKYMFPGKFTLFAELWIASVAAPAVASSVASSCVPQPWPPPGESAILWG